VLAFKREIGTNSVIVVLNMSAEPVSIKLSPESAGGKYTEYFTGSRIKPASLPIGLEPWDYFVFTK